MDSPILPELPWVSSKLPGILPGILNFRDEYFVSFKIVSVPGIFNNHLAWSLNLLLMLTTTGYLQIKLIY